MLPAGEVIKVSSETLVKPFLKSLTKMVGPHNTLVITSRDPVSEWPLHEYIEHLYDVSILNQHHKNNEYDFANECSKGRYVSLKYTTYFMLHDKTTENLIFHTNLGSMHTEFIKKALDRQWDYVIIVPSDDFSQNQISYLERLFR